MQRVRLRRFVLFAVLAVAATVGLAGCQNQPGTAAYVGATRITDTQVDQTVAKIQADLAKYHPETSFGIGDLRTYVVQRMVINELSRQYAQEQKISVPTPDYQTASSQIGLPADDPLVRLSADEDGIRTALLAKAAPQQPTEDEIKGIYDKVTASVGNLGDYATVRPQIVALPTLAPALGLKSELTDAAKRIGVGVSPRYQPLSVPLLTIGSNPQVDIVTMSLGAAPGSPAVQDVS
jgi:SurA-like protein